MQGSAQSTAPPLDLDRYSEATRRKLYDAIQLSDFSPWIEGGNPDSPGAFYSAEAAELRVFFFAGRWFAQWNRLEVPPFEPEHKRIELLRIVAVPKAPEGYVFHEV